MNRLALFLAYIGLLVVPLGVFMVFVPAGVIAAGVELLVVAYMIQYWEARR